MAMGFLLPLRIVQSVFCVVVLILSSFVAHWYTYDTLTFSPTQINFLIFAPIFSFFSIAYLEGAPRFMPKFSHPYAHLAIEFLNTIFYFSGFIALSVFMSSLLFCRGAVCSAARADAVFAAFTFFTWTASTALLTLSFFKTGFGRNKTPAHNEKHSVEQMQMEDTVGSRSESA